MRRFAEKTIKEAEQARGMSKILYHARKEMSDVSISVGIDGQYYTVSVAGGNEFSDKLFDDMGQFFAGYGHHLVIVAENAVVVAGEVVEMRGPGSAPERP